MPGMPRRLLDHMQYDPTNIGGSNPPSPCLPRGGAESGVVPSTAWDCAHWSR
jgi:hypothetical protein